MITAWGYGETTSKFGNLGGTGRVRYVGYCHLYEFIDTILEGDPRGRTWVRDRACITHNDLEVRTAIEHQGSVVVMNADNHQLLKVLKLYKRNSS